ncbi:MAG: transglutaminase-like domain-containing protein [Flavobacteriales bacterium]
MEDKALKAMISLLDDSDDSVYHEIRDKLLNIGYPAIQALEDVWENTFNNLLQTRIEEIIQQIQFNSVIQELRQWVQEGGIDLLQGALLIARYQYPDLDEDQVRRSIDLIKKDVWLELNPNLTAYEKVRVINHILFDVHGFSGNTTNYHAPQNSYINNVMESKKGNPLLLSLIYSIIAQGLSIPIYGVNLPDHFVLAYLDEYGLSSQKEDQQAILFYINPFSRGAVFSRAEIDNFLKQLQLSPEKIYYETCSNIDIIKRLVRNLINAYEKLGYPQKVQDMNKLYAVIAETEED